VIRRVVLSAAAASFVACSVPDPNATTALAMPDRASFPAVQAFLDHRCGTLDCHGTRYRNLRMWGHDGMRLAFGDVPGAAPTTDAETDASYDALIALEPEVFSAVVADHGADPERLTFVRKMRGTENHVGGAIVVVGDVRDMCVTSWLASQVDESACAAALIYP
jgi:hypothetical protein